VNGRPLRIALVALGMAVIMGAVVGGISQLTAVSEVDPRSGTIAVPTASPSPSPDPLPTATPTATGTSQPQQTEEPDGEVWLYTIAIGDSLSGLAIRFGTTTGEILALNPEYAANQDLVQVGSQVIMPCTPIATAEERC